MKCVIQRVLSAQVKVDHKIIGQINKGLLVFVGISIHDNELAIKQMAKKICELRIFSDDNGKFDRSLINVLGDILIVSQFTLLADCSKGRRPNFITAASPDIAKPLVDLFINEFKSVTIGTVQSGEFGADMNVSLENDGPVTIVIDG